MPKLLLGTYALGNPRTEFHVPSGQNGGSLFNAEFQKLLGFGQRFLARVPFRPVPRNFGEALQTSVGVSKRRNDHVSPETRAVFADSPPLVFNLTAPLCLLQDMLRLADA